MWSHNNHGDKYITVIIDLTPAHPTCGHVEGRSGHAVAARLQERPQESQDGVEFVAMNPSAAIRKALRMWRPRTAVSVDLFHITMLASNMISAVRQDQSQQVEATDPARANRILLLKADKNHSDHGL